MYYKLISKMVHFRIVTVAILCLGMPVVLYSIYWYAFAENLKENITSFLLDQVREGVDVSFEQIEVVGYPYYNEQSEFGSKVGISIAFGS